MAVFAFYVLSGYLITRAVNRTYMQGGFTLSGFGWFVTNRILRLWPAYLVVCLASLAFLEHPPLSVAKWVANFTVVGIVGWDFRWMASIPVLVENSWSLSIELVCYALLALGFAKSTKGLWLLAGIGVLALTWSTSVCLQSADPQLYDRYCFQGRYGVLQAGFIPFALGGLVYFHEAPVKAFLAPRGAYIAMAGVISVALFAVWDPLQFTVAPFAGALLAAAFLAWSLDRDFSTRLTFFLGRASYHVFISHYVIGYALMRKFHLPTHRPLLLAGSVGIGLALSYFVLVPVERWADHRRGLLRHRACPGSAPAAAKV
jgi:peptidoglycan/LPS O-acetylase OafA/YrhL